MSIEFATSQDLVNSILAPFGASGYDVSALGLGLVAAGAVIVLVQLLRKPKPPTPVPLLGDSAFDLKNVDSVKLSDVETENYRRVAKVEGAKTFEAKKVRAKVSASRPLPPEDNGASGKT